MSEPNINLIEYFNYTESIAIYKDGTVEEFNKDSEQFNTILESFLITCKDHREMPAFGVSLHQETLQAINSGLWIEFIFNQTYTHNEMPFSKLLIEVNSEYSGFNIIRYSEQKYSGRCFYFDLNNNISNLYNLLIAI